MRPLITLISLLILSSCNVRPEPINFGEDQCHSCKMTIVDRQHAAELVTKKGKVYKFDAAECMIQSVPEFGRENIAYFLVTDFNEPGKLVDAQTATFVVSPNIVSPMRANLCAHNTSESAKALQEKMEGQLYNWDEIQHHLVNN